ncbi:MAG: DUF1501 domain-containing protein, partial [Planctomycetes bacterium]|nr:DUF1501 domain-containing protein [Planctomycetota bacterium]
MEPNVSCRDFQQARCSRRAALTIGSLGMAGLGLPQLLRAEAAGELHQAKARSCIVLFQFGGPSQYETFDPKPE